MLITIGDLNTKCLVGVLVMTLCRQGSKETDKNRRSKRLPMDTFPGQNSLLCQEDEHCNQFTRLKKH